MTPTACRAAETALSMLVVPSPSDPYPAYACLREVDPVFRSPTSALTIVTGFAEVESALQDPRLQVGVQPGVEGAGEIGGLVSTNIRRLIQGALSRQTITRLLPEIQAIVDRLVEGLEGNGVDFMSAVAFPLPIEVMSELFGIPPRDRAQFRSLADAVSLESGLNEVTFARARAAYQHMRGYFRELVAARCQRMAAGDFLTSVLVAAEQENIPLDDLVTHLLVLFWAGFETTAHFLGNGLASLLRHPRQLAALRAGRYSVRSTLHEMLRFDAPVTTVTRLPAVPLRLGHLSLAAGDPVLLAVAAANRDPTVHDAPNDFRPDRRPVRHLSFGSGVHACLGAGLALLEGEALFRHLISRYRVLDFAGEPVRRRGIGLRGFDSLPVLATA